MPSFQKYDIALYGHITIDKIFSEFTNHKTIGAMGNVWDALISTDSSLSIDLKPTAIGEAIILVDKKNMNRVGRGQLNLHTTNTINVSKSKWHHLMYINQLDNVSFVNNIEEGIISADITSGKIKNLELLSIIDFLFISDEDLFMDIDELAKLVKGWVILHYPEGSYSSNGKESVLVKNEILENVNVLGAGDIFAASFMYKHLNDQDIKICIEYAHSNTTYILQQRKLENETTKKKKSK